MSLEFSDFVSKFSGTTPIDIISTLSGPIGPLTSSGLTGPYYGRYFCLGNLLIQFSDLATGQPGKSGQTTYTLNFPYAYESQPYTVVVTPFNADGNNNNMWTTLISSSVTGFTFHIGNNNGAISFLAIGPRPSSLYT